MSLGWTEGVRRLELPNGLILLAQQLPDAPAVAVVSHVRAGFFDEPDRIAGVSHVVEHMLFKGTPTRGVGAIAQETRAAGGYLNAGTGYDHTSYYTVLPPEALGVALDVQSDALRRSLIDPEELRRELRVIIEEAKRKLDTPAAVAGETLHAVLFDQHRIRRWRIGTEAQLAGLSHADVAGYYRSRYVPGRTIVACAGALDPDQALAAARECFEGWPAASGAVDPSPAEPVHREVRARTLRGDVRRAELVLGWRTVPALHPDAAALDIASLVLGAGRASWLYRALRAPGLVTTIGASHFTPPEVGVFSVDAELPAAGIARALERIAEGIERLRGTGPTADDLARVRVMVRARWARRLETAEGRASALAAAESLGDYRLVDEEYGRLLSVRAEDVRRAAGEWLHPEAVGAVAYLPTGAEGELEPGSVARVFGSAGRLAVETGSPALPRVPPAAPARGRETAQVLHVPLPAADLLLRRKPGVPLVSLGVYRRRTMADEARTAGLAALAVRSAVRGAGDFDAAGLALAFERLGGVVTPVVSADWFGFGASVLAEHAAEGAVLLDLVLRAPAHRAEEVARERQTLGEEAESVADDMLRYPFQLALRAAYGDTAYGLPTVGLPETVPGLTEAMVRAWHACELASGRTTVVAVGDLDPPRLAERLAGLFGDPTPRVAAASARAPTWSASGGPVIAAADRDKRQTALAVLYPGPHRGDGARFAAEVWSAIASGLGGRLFSALREKRSLAYSVLASSWQRAAAGALLVYIATSPEREAEARDALLEELAAFRAEPPATDELTRAVNYLSGQALVARQTAGALAGEIAEAWLIGSGLGEIEDPAAGFRAVTGDQVHRMAERAFDPATRVEGVVRGR